MQSSWETPARVYAPGIGDAVADRTVNRKLDPVTRAELPAWAEKGADPRPFVRETWADVALRVARGNVSLRSDDAPFEFDPLHRHLRQASVLMSGRHLQHGDAGQAARNQEVFTNCSTAAASFILFYLLLNGSGVGRSYDDAMTHRILSQSSEEIVVHTGAASFMDDPMLSRNASSSRAIPIAKMIEQVRNDPAMPVHWGKNIPGMQAREEVEDIPAAISQWRWAASLAADRAQQMMNLGLHKQVVNRILETFQWMHVIVTATEWDNFFELRDHEDAEPNIEVLARCMKAAMGDSKPIRRYAIEGNECGWHLPYISDEERGLYRLDVLVKASVARCARVSYLNHDGTTPNLAKDVALYDRLVGSRPLHASPTEHVAFAAKHRGFVKNFRGWNQHRVEVEARHGKSKLA